MLRSVNQMPITEVREYLTSHPELPFLNKVYGQTDLDRDRLTRIFNTRAFQAKSYSLFIHRDKLKRIHVTEYNVWVGNERAFVDEINLSSQEKGEIYFSIGRYNEKELLSIQDFCASGIPIYEDTLNGSHLRTLTYNEAAEKGLTYPLETLNEEQARNVLAPLYASYWFLHFETKDSETVVLSFKDESNSISQIPHRLMEDPKQGALYFQRLGINESGEENEIIPISNIFYPSRYRIQECCMVRDPLSLEYIASETVASLYPALPFSLLAFTETDRYRLLKLLPNDHFVLIPNGIATFLCTKIHGQGESISITFCKRIGSDDYFYADEYKGFIPIANNETFKELKPLNQMQIVDLVDEIASINKKIEDLTNKYNEAKKRLHELEKEKPFEIWHSTGELKRKIDNQANEVSLLKKQLTEMGVNTLFL